MGKLGKKMAKNQKKNKEVQLQEEMNPLKRKMKQQIAEENFTDAIATMSELAKLRCMDPEVMYDGAYSYFMLGDYERAATWIDNTLTYEPNHMMARILLARLCLLEERTEDGLAIFDFVLEHYLAVLPEESREEIEEILEYYGRNEADKLRRRYPHITAFLKLESTADAESAAEPPVAEKTAKEEAEPLAKAQAAVAALKNLMAKTKPSEEKKEIEAAETLPKENITAPAAGKAQSAAAALKNLMAKSEIKEKSGQLADTAEEKLTKTQDALRRLMQKDKKPETAAMDLPSAALAETIPSGEAEEILQRSISVVEKVRLLQAKAGEAFVNNRLAETQSLLQSALELDSCNDSTLRNLAVAAIADGDREQAIDYALRMAETDFLLLDRLRVH